MKAMGAGFISLHLRYWPLGILFTLLMIAGGGYLSKEIGIDSDLKSLLPQSSKSVVHMDLINAKAGGGNDIKLILEGGPFEKRLEAAQKLRGHLDQEGLRYRSYRYQTPKAFLEEHKYQLIPVPQLKEIQRRIDEERKKNPDVTDPFGLEAEIEKEKSKSAEGTTPKEKENNDKTLEEAKSFLNQLEEMRPYFMSEDQKYLVIRIVPFQESLNMSKNKELLEQYKNVISKFNFKIFHPEMTIHQFGKIYSHLERYHSILGDVSFGGWGILVILLLVFIYFRSPWALVVLLPPLVAGIAIGTGVSTLLEGKLNVIAIFLVLVVFGVGIEFGIHLWARMLQERKSKDFANSLRMTWQTTGRATITSSVALLAGFALLTLSSFQGFAQFGRVAIVLIMATAGSFLLFMPSWICFAEKMRNYKAWPHSIADSFKEKANKASLSHASWSRGIRWTSVALGVIGIVLCAFYLRFEYNFQESIKNRYYPPARMALHDAFGGDIKPSALAVFKTKEEAAKFIDHYEQNKERYPDIKQMSGLSSFLPIDQKERLKLLQQISDDIQSGWIKNFEDPEIRKALREIKLVAYDLDTYSIDKLPPEIRDPFIATDSTEDSIVFIFDKGGPADGRKAMRFSEAVEAFDAETNLNPLLSGQEIIFADVVRRVVKEGPWLVLGMFILVFLICWLDFRNLRFALITMSPVAFGFVLTGAILVFLKIDINFFNMVAIASLGAMVVDNSIHFFHRYLGFRNQGSRHPAREASFYVSPTITTCTLTSMSGYGGMVFANHTGIASLGFTAVLGLFCCLLSAVVFFPSWLKSLK